MSTDCCQECGTFLEHADDLVATCTWRVHASECSHDPLRLLATFAHRKYRNQVSLISLTHLVLAMSLIQGYLATGMDDFPYRNLWRPTLVYIYSLIFWSLDLAKLSNKEKFEVLSWCKTHDLFPQIGLMKMVLASARKKRYRDYCTNLLLEALWILIPGFPFVQYFPVTCQHTQHTGPRNEADVDFSDGRIFQEAWTYHGMAIFFSARSPRLMFVHSMRISANRLKSSWQQNATFWNAVSNPWQVLNWGLASTFLSAWQKKDRSCESIRGTFIFDTPCQKVHLAIAYLWQL